MEGTKTLQTQTNEKNISMYKSIINQLETTKTQKNHALQPSRNNQNTKQLHRKQNTRCLFIVDHENSQWISSFQWEILTQERRKKKSV